ncbi:hypothetical protein [Streptomyces sp. ME19-01-6]|uniref:hypothetical protein n=1 Tax=Streptomyces sp. ME19-01-6 TaxID=3028686 RepID=UPI0029A08948|nr:hypothetical protein [Streptomyces sp. ME19-01-6]MDX3232872.1 hypothetical protein [Streptomyces sp. ME19-01-6]
MNVNLSNPQQPTSPQAGQSDVNTAATNFLNDLESAFTQGQTEQWKNVPTSYRDSSPIPAIGPTPPVAQPGRPPMSEAATNISGVMIASSVPILALGGAATALLWASGHADPTVVGLICATPVGLAVPIFALSRLVKRAKQTVEAAPPVHHHHYNGPVMQDHRTVNTQTRGVWAKTRNELPR